MPRLKNRPPRMTRNRNTAIVCIDGRTIRLGRYGTDEAQEAYDRLITEWLSNGRKLPAPTADDGPATVTEILVAYTRHVDQRYDPGKAVIARQVFKLTRSLYGREPVETFGPKRLRVVRDRMIEQDLARSTINERTGWIVRAFKWAASHELCSERIYKRLATVPGLRRGEGGRETAKVKPVPRQHIRRVRQHLSRPVRALIDLQLLTGARADELLRLKATDFDQSQAVWTVTYDGSTAERSHKTAHHEKDRVLYFGPRAQRILNMFMRPGRPLNRPLFSPREAFTETMRRRNTTGQGRRPNQKPTSTATSRTIGDAYTTASYRRSIHYACDKAFLPPAGMTGEARKIWRKSHYWGPHRLRHNAATFLRREYGLEVASIILGHSSLAITQTYAEQNHKRAIEVMREIG